LEAGPNYEINFIPADFTIEARPIIVTADNQEKMYGEEDPNLTYQITEGSLAFEDDFEGYLEREPGEGAGVYAILQGTLTLGDNYDLAFMGAGHPEPVP
jgi:large repetitive protein